MEDRDAKRPPADHERRAGPVDTTGSTLTDADGEAVSLRASVDTAANTVTLSIDRAAFDGVDAADLAVVPAVQSEDRGTLRPVETRAWECKRPVPVAQEAATTARGGGRPRRSHNSNDPWRVIVRYGLYDAEAARR